MSEETAEPQDAPESPPHELRTFMEESARQMAAEYARITARSSEDPGTAGDEGEEDWAELCEIGSLARITSRRRVEFFRRSACQARKST
jgi:hypothetical protein